MYRYCCCCVRFRLPLLHYGTVKRARSNGRGGNGDGRTDGTDGTGGGMGGGKKRTKKDVGGEGRP